MLLGTTNASGLPHFVWNYDKFCKTDLIFKQKKDQNTVTRTSHWTLNHLIDTLRPSNYNWTPPSVKCHTDFITTHQVLVCPLCMQLLCYFSNKNCAVQNNTHWCYPLLLIVQRFFRHFRNDSTDVVEPFFNVSYNFGVLLLISKSVTLFWLVTIATWSGPS